MESYHNATQRFIFVITCQSTDTASVACATSTMADDPTFYVGLWRGGCKWAFVYFRLACRRPRNESDKIIKLNRAWSATDQPSTRRRQPQPALELRSWLPVSCSNSLSVACNSSTWTTRRTRYVPGTPYSRIPQADTFANGDLRDSRRLERRQHFLDQTRS